MSECIQIGTPVTVSNDEFANGFQVGYLHFKTDFQHRPITDKLIYTVIMQNIIDVHRHDANNAGYIVGWVVALLEHHPARRTMLAHILHVPAPDPQQTKEVQVCP